MPSRRNSWIPLAAPAFLVMAGLTAYPLLRSLLLSFFITDYGIGDGRFVGLDNYGYLLGQPFFRGAAWNTILFTLAATGSELLGGLALALLVHRPFPARSLVLPLLVGPFVLSTMVVTAIWRAWFHYDFGFLNALLAALSLPPVPWLFDPAIALWSLVLVDLWQTLPLTFIILLAGLQSIQPEIYEAARIDGAGPGRLLLTITLPLLAPHLLVAALIRSIDSFKIFDKVYALTGGGPGNATETLSLYVYRLGFRFFDIGLASAAAVVMVVVAGLLAAVYAARIMRDRTHAP